VKEHIMTISKEAVSRDKTYRVEAVEKTDPPAGIEGGTWYRYVITLEDKTIVGNQRGTRNEVTQYAKECAENLSARYARGTSTWSQSKKR
jgi:hypothetical protein